jgi:predicted nucleic acid-binding protein
VAAKWYLDEPHHGAATRLKNSAQKFLVPDIFYAEMTNIFWKKIKFKELSTADGVVALADILRAPAIEMRSSKGLMLRAMDHAVALGCAVYDGIYLSLAESIGHPFVTADEKLRRRLRGTPMEKFTRWIGDLE